MPNVTVRNHRARVYIRQVAKRRITRRAHFAAVAFAIAATAVIVAITVM